MPTPARQQYLSIKAQHQDAILLYQVGDFFETFDEDARVASRALQIVLTGRSYGPEERVPLAGVPVHALDTYVGRLLELGHKVAICEQVSPPGRGLVERKVTRILTPGTVTAPTMVAAARDNYLAAITVQLEGASNKRRARAGLAYIEATTGAFACTEWHGDSAIEQLQAELDRLSPAEVLVSDEEATRDLFPAGQGMNSPTVTRVSERMFRVAAARATLRHHFHVSSLAAFGCEDKLAAVSAAGAILSYLEQMNPALLTQARELDTYTTDDFVQIDARSLRALEIVEPSRVTSPGNSGPTLLSTLDSTRTSMGARLLRRTILQPIRDRLALEHRLDAVEALVVHAEAHHRLRALLDEVTDVERLTGRIAQGSATPRDLYALAASLQRVPCIADVIAPPELRALHELRMQLDPCREAVELILRTIADPAEPSAHTIKPGYSADLDALRASFREAREWIASLEAAERERTGIRSLKVGYNKVFGYYIEVTHTHTAKVPAHYQRRQTLTHGERYMTAELKEHEALVLHAEEQIEALERTLYIAVLQKLAGYHSRLMSTAGALAQLDVWLALAEVAIVRNYTRPEISDSTELFITQGRHPVVEANLDGEQFMPNDTNITTLSSSSEAQRIMLLTGPNMAGKSTYLRQVACITLLAHIGSFVPAEHARIGLVDSIFARVGAQDDLSHGLSTFMVEMVETAHILHRATAHSLVILDEVGRGTGARDGLALARAIMEHLHDVIQCRTLFATHYHELASLAEALPGIFLAHMEVIERETDAIFLHRLAPGASTESYGVQIARMAGLPTSVTRRAHLLLANNASAALAESQADYCETSSRSERAFTPRIREADIHDLVLTLAGINIADTTPLDALNLLFALQQRAVHALQVELR